MHRLRLLDPIINGNVFFYDRRKKIVIAPEKNDT